MPISPLPLRGLAAAALVMLAMGVPWVVSSGPAQAACVVTGSGTQLNLLSGDSVACTGTGNAGLGAFAESDITVDIGDGTAPASVDAGMIAGINFQDVLDGTITLHDQSAITSNGDGIVIIGGSGHSIEVQEGASISTASGGSVSIALINSDNNTITVGGTLGDGTDTTHGITISGLSSGNEIDILASGVVQSTTGTAVALLSGGNELTNAGTISATTGYAVEGSEGSDGVFNSGKIESDLTAVMLKGGNDDFMLLAGYNITGAVDGGDDTDRLRFGGATDASFDLSNIGDAAQYRNFEQLNKTGLATWTLTGTTSAVAHTYVIGGTIVVNGDMANIGVDLVGLGGGTLKGTGTIANLTALDTSIVAPGNSIGTLNVAGYVDFNPGSIYQVEVNALGQSDLLLATGAATLDGGTVEVIAYPDYVLDTAYTILTSDGGVTGEFDAVTFSLLFVTPTLTYDANNVYVTLTQTAALGDWAVTPNQIATADALDALGAGDVFDAVVMLGDETEAQAAFDALSGEGHASITGVLVEDSRLVRDAVLGHLEASLAAPGEAGAPGYAGDATLSPSSAYGGGVWGQLYGGFDRLPSDGNAAEAASATGGIVLGAEGVFGDARLGVIANAGTTSIDIADRDTTGASTDYGVGVYGGTRLGGTGLAFGAAYTQHAISTTRQVDFSGFTDSLTADYGAGTGQVFGELSHEFDFGAFALTPFGQLAYVSHSTEAFTETGDAAALATAANTLDATFATLGLRASHQMLLEDGGLLSVTGALGWRHAFAELPTAENAFAGGDVFTVAGAPIAEDALVVEAGLDVDLGTGLDFTLSYDGQLAAGGEAHAVKAGIGGTF